ncbi:MAG: hypothetical protein LBH24_03030 [Clostridiales bacterium]|jgi:hypothetical protein|nr:hypothetical protein [Clostridiales bacterium]
MNRSKPDRSKFFDVDETRKFAAEGVKRFSPVIFAPLSFFLFAGGHAVGLLVTQPLGEIVAILIACGVICLIALTAAVLVAVFTHRSWLRLREVVRNGRATVGVVTHYSVERYTSTDSDGSTSTHHRWDMTYQYTAPDGAPIVKRMKGNGIAAFARGQKLMVAFDGRKAYVLTRYTLRRGGVRELKIMTDDLSSETIPREVGIFPHRFWLYIGVAAFFGGMTLVTAVMLFGRPEVDARIVAGIFAAVSAPFGIAFVYQVIGLIRRIVLLKTARLVRGKVVRPEFYSGRHTVHYYYKDENGRVRSGAIKRPAPHQEPGNYVTVACTRTGKSRVL